MAVIKKNTGTTGDSLLLEHFRKVIDDVKKSEQEMKTQAEENKSLREELKAYMVKTKREHLMGYEYKAVLQPTSTTTCANVKRLFDAIGVTRFLSIVKVSIEAARNHLTQQEMDKHFSTKPAGKQLKIL